MLVEQRTSELGQQGGFVGHHPDLGQPGERERIRRQHGDADVGT
jgi:hypothetical protein